jgi:HAD superfamily hydrolase (TIGR01490 family)
MAITSNQDLHMALTIFDLDETLIAGDSDHAWGEFISKLGLVDAYQYRQQNNLFYQQYLNGTLDVDAYLTFSCEPLSRIKLATLKQLHQQFMQEVISPLMLPKAIALIERHKTQGDELLIITATLDFITEPIAEALGITNILAPQAELLDGSYTGNIIGIPSYADGKVTRLRQWLKTRSISLTGSTFYSDSHNDLPLLSLVDHPIAVDPDAKLEAIAKSKSWQIISLR